MPKRYNVTIPRAYIERSTGKEKTHFWHVGTAFPLKDREGFTVNLYSKMLVTDRFVIFAEDDDQPAPAEPPPHDDLPF